MSRFQQVYDPGLQQERTNLAWDRTALSIMVTSGILLRSIGSPYPQPWHALPALAFLVGLVLLATDRNRYLARWQRMQEGGSPQGWRSIVAVGAIAVVLGVAGLVTIAARHF
ncbi:MAG TPA: DUF202 domain-containing protein [Acidimicrobiia bacterium]|nr:DUF202 domain-containing protein [Acidimicrobiia bacterium]